MIEDLAIVGAGGLGREMAFMIKQINKNQHRWNIIGFYDDAISAGSLVDGFPVLGNCQMLNAAKTKLHVLVAIANPLIRQRIVLNLDNPVLSFPSFIHPTVDIDQTTNVGRGSIITAGCLMTVGITIGEFVVVNLTSTIGHDVVIGDYSSIMPGCNISGNVKIGKRTLVGTGAKILQNINLADDSIIGAGAVVIRSINEKETHVGVPARRIR